MQERSTLIAQAYSECERFLPQGSFAALHLLSNFCDWRSSFRVLFEQLDIGGCVKFARMFLLFRFGHLFAPRIADVRNSTGRDTNNRSIWSTLARCAQGLSLEWAHASAPIAILVVCGRRELPSKELWLREPALLPPRGRRYRDNRAQSIFVG
jgi:hypothetical protein